MLRALWNKAVGQRLFEMCARKYDPQGRKYPFFRCRLCGRAAAYSDIIRRQGNCPCGSRQYSPTNLTLLEEIPKLIRLFLPF